MSKKTTAKKATAETTPKSEAHTGSEHLDFSAGNPAAGEASEKARASLPYAGAATALGLCVLVTLPPAWKVEDPNAKPYWQIEIRDQQGLRYSDVYRVKQLEKAHTLAEKIAKDRKLPIVTKEPPAPRKAQPTAEAEAAPMPDPEAGEDYDETTGTPF